MIFTYLVYGLRLQSDLGIPGLVPLPCSDEAVDLQVYLGRMPPDWSTLAGRSRTVLYTSLYQDAQGIPLLVISQITDRYLHLHHADGTEFVIDRQGQQLWATWPDSLTLEDTATYLLGPVLGFMLRLRGVTCLHASAVVIEHQAVAFVGPAGRGKSTTAATFAQLGYPILADDLVALVWQDDRVLVQPAYPRIRLWPTSVEILYGTPTALPCLTPTWDKRYLDLNQPGYQFQPEPVSLAAIYLLNPRSDEIQTPTIAPLPAAEQLLQLITNTYASHLLDRQMRGGEFQSLSQLVGQVPVKQITAHADPTYLPKLCDLVLQDLHQLSSL